MADDHPCSSIRHLALARIGVFDSGVGGLTILRALRQRLPGAAMLYVGDVAWAPYGDRSSREVIERSIGIVEWLVARGATLVIVACNTATVLAIESLRARWPATVFVGVEPGVKPAAMRSRMRRVAVMATSATASSERLRHLIVHHAQGTHVHVQACPGLADAIERGALAGPSLLQVLEPFAQAIAEQDVDTVVLGCTHYAFVKETIRALLPTGTVLVDTASAVAERAASLWEQTAAPFEADATVRVLSTGARQTMQWLLHSCPDLQDLGVEALTL